MKNNKFKRSIKKGFTLVELVVVIAVIAILAGVSVGAYFGITKSANDSKLLQEAKTASTVLRLANGYGANYSNKGLTIEELDTLNNEVNRVSGSISYYLTIDINSYSNDVSTIQFVKVDTSLDLNTYDYFRYYAKGDTSRYCLFSLVNDSSSLHDNVPSVPTTVEEGNTIAGDQVAMFQFNNESSTYLGDAISKGHSFNNNGYTLKVEDCSEAYLGKFHTNDVLNLSCGNKSELDYAFVTFEIPSDVSKVVIRYGAYNSSYPVKININDTIMTTSYATLAADEKNIPYATITMGSNKIVTIKTTESNKHASIDYIAFYK